MIEAMGDLEIDCQKYRINAKNEAETLKIPTKDLKLPCIAVLKEREDGETEAIKIIGYTEFLKSKNLRDLLKGE